MAAWVARASDDPLTTVMRDAHSHLQECGADEGSTDFRDWHRDEPRVKLLRPGAREFFDGAHRIGIRISDVVQSGRDDALNQPLEWWRVAGVKGSSDLA